MHKPVLTHVNANMRKRMARGVEENKVSGQTVFDGNLLPESAHFGYSSGQLQTLSPSGNVDHEPAAVKAPLGRVSSPAIGHPHQPNRMNGHF